MNAITLTSIDGSHQIKQHIFIEDSVGSISLCGLIRPSNDGNGVASLSMLSNEFETLEQERCCKKCLLIYNKNY